jgi:serine/threonine protein kinase
MSQLSENLRHRVWMDVSRGIEYIHSQNVNHFDVKPSNILLGDRAVLCDFGTSVKGTVKPTSSRGGTPCYVPPEYLYDNL